MNVKDAVMEWIAVEDGLPELGEEVMIFNQDNLFEIAERAQRGKSWSWWCYKSNRLKGKNWATHWMRVDLPTGYR